MEQHLDAEEQPKTPYLLEDLAEPSIGELKDYESDTPALPKDESVRDNSYLFKLLNHPILSPEEERKLFLELRSAKKSWVEKTMQVGLAAFRVAQIGMNGVSSLSPQTMIRRSFNQEPQIVIESADFVIPHVYELVYSNRALLENSEEYDASLIRLVEKNSSEHSQTLAPWNAATKTLEGRLEGEENIPGLMQYASKIGGLKSKKQIYRAIAAELGIVPEALLDIIKDIMKHRDIYYQKRDEGMRFNQRLVFHYAKKFEWGLEKSYISLEDLHNIGNIGLMKGIEKFDVEKGYKFSTYGTWWIQQSIRRELQNSGSAVRVPIHVQERLSGINLAIKLLHQEHQDGESNYVPSVEEIMDATGFSEKVINIALNSGRDKLYFDAPRLDDTNAYEIIADTSQPAPYETAHQNLVGKNIANALATLTAQEQRIITLRFGLEDGVGHTLEEIGEEYHICRERIRQLEARALRKLRHPTRMKILQVNQEDLKE